MSAAGARERSPVTLPLLGIAALLVFNAACDVAARGALAPVQPGGFLHLAWRDGVPSGALVDVLQHSGATILLAIGMTLVVAGRGIDLSVGSIQAVAGAAAAMALASGAGGAGAIAIALAAGVVLGAWNALLVAGCGLQPFVATLVLMVAGRGLAQRITDGQIATFHDAALEGLGAGRLLGVPVPFVLGVGGLVLVGLLVRRTALGMLLTAIGVNPEAARLAGVRTRAIVAGTYVASGACAAVAGLIAAASIKAADPFHAGQNAELAAIFAVVVGGTSLSGGRFSLLGAAASAVFLQTLTTTLYARDVRADIAPLPQALLILVVCIVASPVFRARASRASRPAGSAQGSRA